MPDGTLTDSVTVRVIMQNDRERNLSRIAELVALRAERPTERFLKEALEQRSSVLVGAFSGEDQVRPDQLIGITHGVVLLQLSGKRMYVDNLIVDPSYPRGKVGRKMVDTIMDVARAMKCTQVEFISPEHENLELMGKVIGTESRIFRTVL